MIPAADAVATIARYRDHEWIVNSRNDADELAVATVAALSGFTPTVRHRSDSLELLQDMIVAGLGVRARRVAAEQASLARELGEDVKEMELFLRTAYELPLHDVEREKDVVRGRLQSIEARMVALRASHPPDLSLHYAVKANPYAPLLRHMLNLVDGLDVASAGEMRRALEAADVPASRLFDVADCANDPHFRARGAVLPVDDPLIGATLHPGPAIRLDGDPPEAAIGWTGPALGAHTRYVLDTLLAAAPPR